MSVVLDVFLFLCLDTLLAIPEMGVSSEYGLLTLEDVEKELAYEKN